MDGRLFYSYNAWRGGAFALPPDIVKRDIHDRAVKFIREKEMLTPIEIKSDKKIQTKHMKGIRSFLAKEKEKVGVLVGRFEDADILEEGKTRIYMLPYWMI